MVFFFFPPLLELTRDKAETQPIRCPLAVPYATCLSHFGSKLLLVTQQGRDLTAGMKGDTMLAPGRFKAGIPNLTDLGHHTKTHHKTSNITKHSFQGSGCKLEKGFQLYLTKQLFKG